MVYKATMLNGDNFYFRAKEEEDIWVTAQRLADTEMSRWNGCVKVISLLTAPEQTRDIWE